MAEARRAIDLHIPASTVWKLAAQVLAVAATAWVLSRVGFAVSWIFIALLLALAMDPPVQWLERRRLPRWAAVLVVMAVVVALIGALIATLVPLLVDQGRAIIDAAPMWLDRLQRSEMLAWADRSFGVVARAKSEAAAAAAGAATSALSVVGSVFFGLAGFVTVIVLAAFMLLFGGPLVHKALEWVEPGRRPHVLDLTRRMQQAVGGYVAGSLVIASIGGVVTAVTLLVLGVPYYVPLGLLMVVLGLVPYVGPVIGGGLVVGATFLSSGATNGLIALVVFVAYQQVENQLLQPLVQRRTIHMNPLLIALVMLLGTAYAGVVGALLALPIAGAVQVLAQSALARRKRSWTAARPPARRLRSSPGTARGPSPNTKPGRPRHRPPTAG